MVRYGAECACSFGMANRRDAVATVQLDLRIRNLFVTSLRRVLCWGVGNLGTITHLQVVLVPAFRWRLTWCVTVLGAPVPSAWQTDGVRLRRSESARIGWSIRVGWTFALFGPRCGRRCGHQFRCLHHPASTQPKYNRSRHSHNVHTLTAHAKAADVDAIISTLH